MAGKLPDDFLKDLEDLSEDDQAPEDYLEQEVAHNNSGLDQGFKLPLSLPAKGLIPEISKLKLDPDYQSHLVNIQNDLNTVHPADKFINLEKGDIIYSLIKKSNTYMMEIESEIQILHKEIRDIYLQKFSELESIVYDPIEYTK